MTGKTSNASVLWSREALAADLEQKIVSGAFATGDKLLSERQLADEYGVSRPVIREALRTLVERNLVIVSPGRGAFVREARSSDAASQFRAHFHRSGATAKELVEARTMLECAAAELAAERATETDIAAMERANNELLRTRSVITQARADLAFHLAIVRSARNPVIETMFGSITGLTLELMLRSLSDRSVAGASLPYHQAVIDGIRDGDGTAARRAMADHLAVASQMYGPDYETSIERVAEREMARLFAPGVTLEDLLEEVVMGVAGDFHG